MQDDIIVDLTNTRVWYYNEETGLYYDNKNLVGMGYHFHEIEEMADYKIAIKDINICD